MHTLPQPNRPNSDCPYRPKRQSVAASERDLGLSAVGRKHRSRTYNPVTSLAFLPEVSLHLTLVSVLHVAACQILTAV